MKLNKKGITLIEIIISIVLISIVLIFLFTMLIAVNDMNSESEMDSTYLINKSLFVKNVEEDLKYADHTKPINIYGCNIKDFFTAYDDTYINNLNLNGETNQKATECIKLEYTDINDITTTAYIGIFYLKTQDSYVISYSNGTSRSTRKLPDFITNNVASNEIKYNSKLKIKYSSGERSGERKYEDLDNVASINNNGFVNIEIPIIGPDGKDYTIMIPYYGEVTIN